MHIHPPGKNKDPLASSLWYIVEARGSRNNKGVLKTTHSIMGENGIGYDPALQGSHHLILGSLKANDAKEAAKSLEDIKCTGMFPAQNCVDWTRIAVDHLHQQKHISDSNHAHFMDIYNTHQGEVRKRTDTAVTREGVGVPKNDWRNKIRQLFKFKFKLGLGKKKISSLRVT